MSLTAEFFSRLRLLMDCRNREDYEFHLSELNRLNDLSAHALFGTEHKPNVDRWKSGRRKSR